jgi:hypothetical protein
LCAQRRAYKVKAWDGAADFLTRLAHATGKLMRGGEPDLNTAAKMVLYDWQRGKIPFFRLPPDYAPDAAPERAPAAAADASVAVADIPEGDDAPEASPETLEVSTGCPPIRIPPRVTMIALEASAWGIELCLERGNAPKGSVTMHLIRAGEARPNAVIY